VSSFFRIFNKDMEMV